MGPTRTHSSEKHVDLSLGYIYIYKNSQLIQTSRHSKFSGNIWQLHLKMLSLLVFLESLDLSYMINLSPKSPNKYPIVFQNTFLMSRSKFRMFKRPPPHHLAWQQSKKRILFGMKILTGRCKKLHVAVHIKNIQQTNAKNKTTLLLVRCYNIGPYQSQMEL